ncbi:MAG: SMP-30/gluconolactonase/LRE family protein [Fodinibius sp.]|nr:SMP-30/gluconolactonase/LRE family protein [Fodinibius sp.]
MSCQRLSLLLLVALLMPLLLGSTVFGQQIIPKNAEPEKVTTGYEFTEGPIWHPDGYLLSSRCSGQHRCQLGTGRRRRLIFCDPAAIRGQVIAFDQQGRLLLAQHDGAVSRLTEDKTLTEIVSEFEGKRLNSPNDLAVKSDGSIYFTDPPFGVDDENRALDFSGVYRYSKSEGLQLLVDDFNLPNGIVFSPDEERLYVNDTGANHIRVFEVNDNGTLGSGEIFATMEADADGAADGMKVDTDGNLYSTGPAGLWIFAPSGELLQQVDTPRITNLAWGGPDRQTLFMTSPSAILRLQTNQTGQVTGW